MISLLAFSLDQWHCALPLSAVERSYRAVAVTPLPDAPEKVLGIVNVHGIVYPVIDLRRCFGLPSRPVSPADHLILGHTTRRRVGLMVDSVSGVIECRKAEIVEAETVLPEMEYVSGIVRLKDGVLLIHDLDRFLSLEEEEALDQALEA
jgi:purine-binding chemotaxis protein CheW